MKPNAQDDGHRGETLHPPIRKVVHFGAGNIGRGFLGQLYSQSGWQTVFVDVDDTVVQALNRRRSYSIEILSDAGRRFIEVSNVRAVNGRDTEAAAAEIADADLLGTSVGASLLRHIAPVIAAGLARRAQRNAPPISIVICENLLNSAAVLKNLLLDSISEDTRRYIQESVGFAETVVSRMVPVVPDEKRRADPLYIGVEPYAVLPVDRRGFPQGVPQIDGMEFHDNLEAYEERKLFTHNCGHSLYAYFGYERGLTYIWEAVADEQIRARVLAALDETSRALIRKHGFSEKQQQEHVDDLLARFASRALGDTVSRVARDPIRKLGPRDRLVGAARLVIDTGGQPANIAAGIRSALNYRNPDDPAAVQLARMIDEKGIEYVLQHVCKLKPGEKLYEIMRG